MLKQNLCHSCAEVAIAGRTWHTSHFVSCESKIRNLSSLSILASFGMEDGWSVGLNRSSEERCEMVCCTVQFYVLSAVR
jgi:hypothetical protein